VITAEKILTRAIEGWRTKGWTQGHAVDTEGRTCLLGGISSATGDLANCYRYEQAGRIYDEQNKATKAIAEVLGGKKSRNTAEYADRIIGWNDTDGRTVEEVITAAEQARANLKLDR
jgi:hypothetical protein